MGRTPGFWGVCALAVVSACSGSITGSVGGPGAEAERGRSPGGGSDGEGPGDGRARPGDTPGDELEVSGVAQCEERSLPGQPLRRLSSTQYHNTLRDLFGPALAEPLLQGSLFPETSIVAGFASDAEANVVNTAESNAIEDNAERIAEAILADPARYVQALVPCELPDGFADSELDACIDDFIAQFGLRAYRRPLTGNEAAIARGLYDDVRAQQSAREGFSALVQLFVQSPALLYRVERGAGLTSSGLLRLTDYEMATRLSYFFLDSMPDAELFEAAAAGELSTPQQVADQARRLIELPAFRETLDGFHRDWLRLYELANSSKDQSVFPEFTPQLQAALLEEPSRLVAHVLDRGEGNIAALLGSAQIPVNATLAAFYEVEAPGADDDNWVPVEVEHRLGLLTLASFMATLADADKTNPVHRGVFVQKEILCNRLPAFPGNIDTQGPLENTAGRPTARERLSPLLENGACMGCHAQFNPTGLALENYDAIGRFREQENGAAIDPSATVMIDGTAHDFETPTELVAAVAESDQAHDCYTLQWYRAAMGRREFAEDECSLVLARRAAADSGGDLRELLVAITQTDGFLYRLPPEGGEP